MNYDEIFGKIPPKSTTFEFPLYLTVPFVGMGEAGERIYERPKNDIDSQLFDWFVENAELIFDDGVNKTYEAYPEVYVNGAKVIYICADVNFMSPKIESINVCGYTEAGVYWELTIYEDDSTLILWVY